MALNPRLRDWSGRRVWLVGASSGIGAALAHTLAGQGARLALSARRADKLAGLCIMDALCLPVDVTDAGALQQARNHLMTAWGGIDVVIYLAGDYVPMRRENFDPAVAARILAVNYQGAVNLFAAVRDDLPPGGGIVFVASVAGYRGLPQSLCYGPGKAALIHFAECLHFDYAPRGIGVWVVNPGFVETPLTAQNRFAMPALISAEAAAKATVDGLASGDFDIHYPKRFTRLMKCLAHLPYRLYFPLIRRLTGG